MEVNAGGKEVEVVVVEGGGGVLGLGHYFITPE